MPTYKVTYRQTSTYAVVIDAESEEEAHAVVAGGNYHDPYEESEVDFEDCEVQSVVEVEAEIITIQHVRRVSWVAVQKEGAT